MENNEDNKDPIIVFAKTVCKSEQLSDSQKDLLIREYIRNDKKIVESKITPIINDNKKAYFLGSIALISLCLILLVIVFEWAIKEKIFTTLLLNLSFSVLLLGLIAMIVITMIWIKNKVYDSSSTNNNQPQK